MNEEATLRIEMSISNESSCTQVYVNGKWFTEIGTTQNVFEAIESVVYALRNDEDFKL